MLLYLYSDRNYLKDGFEAYYFIYDCPWNCSNRGVCTNHTCRCHAGYYGDGCQHQVCVDNCNGHGTCVPVSRSMQRCECDEGYAGHSCDVSLSDGGGQARWYTLQPSGSGFKGRTSTQRCSSTTLTACGCLEGLISTRCSMTSPATASVPTGGRAWPSPALGPSPAVGMPWLRTRTDSTSLVGF